MQSKERVSLCLLCGYSELPGVANIDKNSNKRKTRSNGSTPVIECDNCKERMHPVCCGLTADEYQKIKSRKSFYKCIRCCLSAVEGVSLRDYVRNSVLAVEAKEVKESNPIAEVAQVKDTTSAISTSSAAKEVVPKKEEVKDKKRTSEKDAINLVSQGDKEIREKILLIDDIKDASEFRNSGRILSEIKKVSNVVIEFAYHLAKGGIAIHTTSPEDKDKLYKELVEETAFKGGRISKLSEEKHKKVFLKNVDTRVSNKEITGKFQRKGIEIIDCKRIENSVTRRPTRTVRVLVKSEDFQKALDIEIWVGEVKCTVEKPISPRVVSCYECQQFGHISNNCVAAKCCVVCAGDHPTDFKCKLPTKCRNCGGAHPASDNTCPIYCKYNADLSK